MHEGAENLQVLGGGDFDVFLAAGNDVHEPSSHFCHEGAGGHGVGDALFLCFLVHLEDVTQTEGLGSLRAHEGITRNGGVGTESVEALEDGFAALDARDGVTVGLTGGDVPGNDFLAQQGTYRIVDEYKVLAVATLFLESEETVVDGFHAGTSPFEYPAQLVDVELVGIALKDRFPSFQAHHGDGSNVRMALETLHGVDDDGCTVDVHELLGNVLSHAVAGTSGDDEGDVHIVAFEGSYGMCSSFSFHLPLSQGTASK